ncbi:hypothetical protein H9P43_006288 [Blastocladiella emersonii ATCC 22665]|nr:hypothetical protein H9P43_006288 [Blastocladiella emersonii ATCC 22665]
MSSTVAGLSPAFTYPTSSASGGAAVKITKVTTTTTTTTMKTSAASPGAVVKTEEEPSLLISFLRTLAETVVTNFLQGAFFGTAAAVRYQSAVSGGLWRALLGRPKPVVVAAATTSRRR